MIDLNAALGRWPFAAGWGESVEALSAALVEAGIRRAYVSAVEAILGPDPLLETQELCQRILGHGVLFPVAVIDPGLRTALKDLSRLARNWPIRLVKLYPNFGGYAADEERTAELVRAAAGAGVLTAVVMRVEDERNQHPLLRVGPVPAEAVVRLAGKVAPLPVLALNGLRGEVATVIREAPNVMADIAFVESGASLPDLLEQVPAGRVVFGSHAPFFYPRAAAAKLASPELTAEQRWAVASGNAEAALAAAEQRQVRDTR
jgi:predicted TIM-barrel fold metal-dependent hydrolase